MLLSPEIFPESIEKREVEEDTAKTPRGIVYEKGG